MKRLKLSSGAILIIYCVCVFFISLFVSSRILNEGNVDMTAQMEDATFPVITFSKGKLKYNSLHGYAGEMDITHMRDCITVTNDDRKVPFRIETYGNSISTIKYELRSTDGSRLIEESELDSYVKKEKEITGTIELKDLIFDHTEYSLIITLVTSGGKELNYYTKLVEAEDYALKEKLDFVYSFSEATFDKKKAEEEITTFVESNEEGDNTTFNKVNIHSSLNQITYGDLNAKRETEPVAQLMQIDESIAVVKLNYFISTSRGSKKYYRVEEKFRIRLGDERMYLLDYNRSMNEIFSAKQKNVAKNKIELGIVDPNVNMVESKDGNHFAFVNDGRLFSYNVADNKLSYVFGFFEDIADERNTYNKHDIKIFNVDETGSIYFLVYGYMNRGNHEGEMGSLVYHYDTNTNSIEELVFVPSNQPFEMLEKESKNLSYIDESEDFFVLDGNKVFKIVAENGEIEEIASFKDENSIKYSYDSSMIAYVSDGFSASSELKWYDMKNEKKISIPTKSGDYIRPIGFFGNNLVYGVAHKTDITTDISGKIIFPIYSINIVDENLNIVKTYDASTEYVVDFNNDGQYMINLKRMKKDSTGAVSVDTSDDQLIDNISSVNRKNEIVSSPIEVYETIVEIAFNKEVDSNKTQILTPKILLYEGNRTVSLERTELEDRFYVYEKGEFAGTFDTVSDASQYAYENGGAVYNSAGILIYQKTTLAAKNQIMAITGAELIEGEDATLSTAVCINTILQYEEIYKDTRNDIIHGKEPYNILKENLETAEVYNFGGCDLEVILYYVEKDIPVLVLFKDGTSMLIVGYNEFNTVVMDPQKGTVYKIGINDSKTLFGESGNRFITYIKNY